MKEHRDDLQDGHHVIKNKDDSRILRYINSFSNTGTHRYISGEKRDVGKVDDLWSGHEEDALSIKETDRMENCLLEAKAEQV